MYIITCLCKNCKKTHTVHLCTCMCIRKFCYKPQWLKFLGKYHVHRLVTKHVKLLIHCTIISILMLVYNQAG